MVLALGLCIAGPRMLPWALAQYRPDLEFIGATDEKKLFLTIDDAPSKHTAEILRVLEKHEVPAAFFIIASRVKAVGQLEEIFAGGHSLGNHLTTTQTCSTLSLDHFKADFEGCATLLGARGSKLFRPASDFGTKPQIEYVRSKGYRATMGTAYPLDHWISDPDVLVCITRWLSVRGGIIILHDGDENGNTTAEVLDRLIPKLKADGYVFNRLDRSNQ